MTTYLSEMEKERVSFYKELREAVEVYFNAAESFTGRSDAESMMIIIADHVEHYFPGEIEGKGFEWNTSLSDPGVTLVEGEGLNIAYDLGSAIDGNLFRGLTTTRRIELLEACIYALNTRINNIENKGDDAAD
jgi:hypothetical protein